MDTEIIKNQVSLDLAQQIGNVGSELSRAYVWQSKHDTPSCQQALGRALEILDEAIVATKEPGPLKELTRLREIVADCRLPRPVYDGSIANARNYCLNFALLARAGR